MYEGRIQTATQTACRQITNFTDKALESVKEKLKSLNLLTG